MSLPRHAATSMTCCRGASPYSGDCATRCRDLARVLKVCCTRSSCTSPSCTLRHRSNILALVMVEEHVASTRGNAKGASICLRVRNSYLRVFSCAIGPLHLHFFVFSQLLDFCCSCVAAATKALAGCGTRCAMIGSRRNVRLHRF